MYIPPTAVLEITLGLGFDNAGVTIDVPCLEWEVYKVLPGVGGISLRSFVVTERFRGRKLDEDVFLRM